MSIQDYEYFKPKKAQMGRRNIMFTAILIVLACTPGQEFANTCQEGFERTYGQVEGAVWLGSSAVVINNRDLEPLTSRCLDESPNRPAKKSLEQVVANHASNKQPKSTQKATMVAWVKDGIIHVAVNAKVGEFEKSLLHLIKDSDSEENISDEWLAYSVKTIGPFKKEWIRAKDGEMFTIFHLGPAKKDIGIEEAVKPLIDLNVLSLVSS